MRHPRAICASLAPRHQEPLKAASPGSLSLATLALVVLAAGCGGTGKSGGKATSAGESSTSSATTATTTGASEWKYEDRELASIPLRDLQACPSGDFPEWAVLYQGLRAYVRCGMGSARVRAGNTSMRLENGYCSIDKRGGVTYEFGSYIYDEDVPDSVLNRKDPSSPHGFGVSLGYTNITPSYKITTGDGTYVDTPVNKFEKAKYGITVVVSGDGKLWENDFHHHTTTVTLTHGRTRGSFTATTEKGESMSGTFQCGSRIDGSGAPQS